MPLVVSGFASLPCQSVMLIKTDITNGLGNGYQDMWLGIVIFLANIDESSLKYIYFRKYTKYS